MKRTGGGLFERSPEADRIQEALAPEFRELRAHWDRWLREMRGHMSRSRVRAEGKGKRRSWRWTR